MATKGTVSPSEAGMEVLVGRNQILEVKPAVTEAALLAVLEKLFDVVLNLPTVNRLVPFAKITALYHYLRL